MKTMKALVYEKPGRKNGSIRDVPYPVCGDSQIIMKVMSCGICKAAESSHDKNGSVLGKYPATPGHEFAGIVEEIGKNVTNFHVGDRITADNGVPCGKCDYCQSGQPAFCTSFCSLGHNLAGGMAEYVLLAERSVFRIPDNVSFNSAALCELIGCCIHCIDRCNIRYGDSVAVLGCGSSGMILAQLLKHSHSGRVVVLDSVQSKLDTIRQKGLETFLIDRNDYIKHETLLRQRFPLGLDKVIDTTGCVPLINHSLGILKSGGTFAGYSFPSDGFNNAEINIATFIVKELSYIGSTFQNYNFRRCLDALESGVVDSSAVITNEFSLDKYFQALDLNLNDPETIKVMIHPNY